MILKCQPFYLPRECTAILLAAVYITPNSTAVMETIHLVNCTMPSAHPDGFLIVAGDFNADQNSVSTTSSSSANLFRVIREANRQHTSSIAHSFSDTIDTRSFRQGIQTITDYKPRTLTCDNDIALMVNLNSFFARFDANNSTLAQKSTLSRRSDAVPVSSQCKKIPLQD